MKTQKQKNIKGMYLLLKKIFTIFFLTIFFFSCLSIDGTYFEYLKTPPKITSDFSKPNIFASVKIEDSTVYYFYDTKVYRTKDLNKVEGAYLIAIKTMKNGKKHGKWVYLNGFGDTTFVSYYKNGHVENIE